VREKFLDGGVERLRWFPKSDRRHRRTTNGVRLVFHIMGALLAEFGRDLIRERTKAGMKAAQKRGKHAGRPKSLSNGQVQHMLELLDAGKTQAEVAELFGVSANTIGRKVREKINTKTIVKK